MRGVLSQTKARRVGVQPAGATNPFEEFAYPPQP